jgi:general secretion pathway protein K
MRWLSPSGQDGERGIALVAALWFSVALAGIAASFSVLARGETMRNQNMVDAIRARAILEAALERGVVELTNPSVRPEPTGTRVVWTFDNAGVVIDIRGESGKIDLNQVDSKFIAAVIQELGGNRDLGERVGDAIVDWRDDNSLRQAHGAEDRDYRMADRKNGPANAPFSSTSELRDVLPVTPELFDQMRDLLTVSTGQERPKLELAPALVRRAALSAGPPERSEEQQSGMSESGADIATGEADYADGDPPESREANIEEDPFGSGLNDEDVQDPDATGNEEDQDQQRRSDGFVDPASLYALRIDVKLFNGYEAHADAVIWLQDEAEGRPYRLLSWDPSPLRPGPKES